MILPKVDVPLMENLGIRCARPHAGPHSMMSLNSSMVYINKSPLPSGISGISPLLSPTKNQLYMQHPRFVFSSKYRLAETPFIFWNRRENIEITMRIDLELRCPRI